MTRREKLGEIFKHIGDDQLTLIDPLLDEVVFLEDKMRELRAEPFLRFHPDDRSRQKTTPAAKQYKECSQSYMNAIRILNGILKGAAGDEADELLAQLGEFM